ncbi:MAG: PEP-CTERM sorting domain-containing protein [Burkholderiaceae bacterium]|nr:PEP-CTERM sorting domain-containing protein [Burkholderiaceae bacterium]
MNLTSTRLQRLSMLTAAVALGATLATPALAKPAQAQPTACSFSDLTGATVTGCSGYIAGNLLQGNTGATVSAAVATQLAALGVADASHATYVEKIGSLGGGSVIDFSTVLSGTTVIGLHLGGGSDKFTNGNVAGGATAFYLLQAGSSLDSLGLASYMTASSGVALFETQAAPVPEPQTWALMLGGLAGVGFIGARRRRQGV